jgi:hypothetical protein
VQVFVEVKTVEAQVTDSDSSSGSKCDKSATHD